MTTNAQFPVRRVSPNLQVWENILVWARDPGEARAIASEDGWTVTTCGPALRDSAPDYGPARIVRQPLTCPMCGGTGGYYDLCDGHIADHVPS